MCSTLIFHLILYINVLNYRYVHTDCSTFLKIKKRWKNKKETLINVYCNYVVIGLLPLLFGTVYLPSAETVLDLLLRHSEKISKLIWLKLLFMTTAYNDWLRLRIGLPRPT